MKRVFTVLAVVVMVAGAAVTGLAMNPGGMGKRGGGQGMGGGMGMGPGMGICRMLDNPQFISELGLSDSQVSKLKEIQSESQRQSIKLKAELDIIRLDMRDAIDQDKPNTSAVDKLIDKMGAIQVDMEKNMIHSMIDMKNVLTDEQKDKIQELMEERMKDREKQGKGTRSKSRAPGNAPGQGGGMGFGPGAPNFQETPEPTE